jgi:hypothetical protein
MRPLSGEVGTVSGLHDRCAMAGRSIEPETNCAQQRYDDDHTEQQSDDI